MSPLHSGQEDKRGRKGWARYLKEREKRKVEEEEEEEEGFERKRGVKHTHTHTKGGGLLPRGVGINGSA